MAREHPHSFSYEWDEIPYALLRGFVSPTMAPRTLYLGAYDLYHGTDRLDRHETLLFSGSWFTASSMAYFMSGKWMTGGSAQRMAIYLASNPVTIAVAVAAASGAGYVATSDVHGGVIPGVTSPGGLGPGGYGSDPMGEFESGVREFFAYLGF